MRNPEIWLAANEAGWLHFVHCTVQYIHSLPAFCGFYPGLTVVSLLYLLQYLHILAYCYVLFPLLSANGRR